MFAFKLSLSFLCMNHVAPQVDYERSCATQPVEEAQDFSVCTASRHAQGRVVALVSFTSPPHLALTSYRSFRATDLPSRLALSIKIGRPPRAELIGGPGAPPDVDFVDARSPSTIRLSSLLSHFMYLPLVKYTLFSSLFDAWASPESPSELKPTPVKH